jgi:iron complex outermembrane receptor protein
MNIPHRPTIHLHPIAAACALLAATLAGNAWAQATPDAVPVEPIAPVASAAQEAEAPAITSVVVAGIRRGIEDAISVKKNSDSIVEAISAEDIGKLPDASIAESIARLPGVTAQRTAGRAQAISIRGMSPDFSTALLNGREQVSTGDSRGVEFDQYPAELLSGVTIYKTPDGALVGQGLAGTADMLTVRPLDFGKRTIALNARKTKSGVGLDKEGDGTRSSASYIDQFANRTIGIALGAARLKDNGAATTRFSSWGAGTLDYNGTTVNVPYNGVEGWTQQQTDSRDGAMAVLQFRPNRDFNSTLDLFYSKYKHAGMRHGWQAGLNDWWIAADSQNEAPGQLSNAVLNGNDVVSGTFNNVHAIVANVGDKAVETSKSAGWKTTARLGQDWSATLDLSYNKATRKEDIVEAYAGTAGNGTVGAFDSVNFVAGSQQFTTGFNYSDPSIIRLTDVAGWGGNDTQAAYIKNSHVADQIKAVRLSAKRDLPEGLFFSNVDVGVNLSDRSKRREFREFLGTIKDGGADRFASSAIPNASVGYAGDTGVAILVFDPVAAAASVYDFNEKRNPAIYNKDWIVKEKVNTAYTKLNVDSTLAGIPVRGNVGLQYVRTDQSSSAYSVDSDGGESDANRPVTNITAGKVYHDVLPSANFGFEFAHQQNVRLAVSKVMARPTLNDLRASNGFGVDTTKNVYSGGGGNPKLDPFRAKALDISYEKYFDKQGYVAAAAFYKKIDSYIVNITNNDFDFTPYLGQTNIPLPSPIGDFVQPTNGSGGFIKGVELSASIPLNLATKWLDGFGVYANYAYTTSSLNVPDTTDGGSGNMPLPGLSKITAGLTVYYEKNGFSGRVAQRYRSAFVGDIQTSEGDRQATYIKGEKILDLQLGYEFRTGWLKGASLLLQMNNLTNAEFVRYRKVETNIVEQTRYGRTVLLGLNYRM